MKNKNRKSIIAIALITAVCLAGDSMLYIVLPIHWKEAGLSSLVQVGILLSINRFVRLPLNPLIGYIYTKINFQKGILLAAILGGITTIGYGMAEDFPFWVILRSLWGLAWTLFKMGAFLLLLQMSSDENRGSFMGTYNGLYRLGSLFGMLLGGFFADLVGIKFISILLGCLAFATVPFIYKYTPITLELEVDHTKPKGILHSIQLFKDSQLTWMFVTAFHTVIILEGMMNATLSYVIDFQVDDSIHVFGLIVGAATLAGIMQAVRWGVGPIISPLIGGVLDIVRRKHYMLSNFLLLSAIFLLLIPLKIPLMIWLPLLLVNLLLASSITTIVDSMVSNMASKRNHKIMAMTVYTILVDFRGSAWTNHWLYI